MKFLASAYINRGEPALQLRKIFLDREEISDLVSEIIVNKKLIFVGEVSFKDPLSARIRLKELGIYPTERREDGGRKEHRETG